MKYSTYHMDMFSVLSCKLLLFTFSTKQEGARVEFQWQAKHKMPVQL